MIRNLGLLNLILAHTFVVATAEAASIRTVAITGQAAPGAGPSNVYNEFGSPALNNAGQVAFLAKLAGDGVTSASDGGVWSEGSGALNLVAREGEAAPGTDALFTQFNTPVLNDAGQVAVRATLVGGTVTSLNSLGIWSESNGPGAGISLVVQERTQAPGTAQGTNFFIPGSPSINEAGQVSLISFLADGPGLDGDNNAGIWSQDAAGDLQLRMRTGQQAPGLDAGITFTSRNAVVHNDTQDVAFRGFLAGPGVTNSNDVSIWTANGNELSLIAREGDAAPGTSAGETFGGGLSSGAAFLGINDAGQVAFRATLNGAPAATDGGVWSQRGGELSLVAREGDSAPGLAAGVNFSRFFDPRINGSGQVAFVAQTTNSRTGIWSEGGGELSLVALQGDQVTGLDPGVVFNSFSNALGTTEFAFNARGQMAFVANLVGTGVTGSNNSALMMQVDGTVSVVAREGDLFEVAPGDRRTISLLNILDNTGNEDGFPSSFNDAGQLAFRLSFSNASQGIFVVNTVPEPTSLLLVVLATVACLSAHRGRRNES